MLFYSPILSIQPVSTIFSWFCAIFCWLLLFIWFDGGVVFLEIPKCFYRMCVLYILLWKQFQVQYFSTSWFMIFWYTDSRKKQEVLCRLQALLLFFFSFMIKCLPSSLQYPKNLFLTNFFMWKQDSCTCNVYCHWMSCIQITKLFC